jgi:TonB family protein
MSILQIRAESRSFTVRNCQNLLACVSWDGAKEPWLTVMRNTGPRWCGDTVLECPPILPKPLLAALCLALATLPLAQAQDATSITLPEGPSKTATPTAAPEKPSLEILAGTPDHQKPAPKVVPEQTPSAPELATPALKAEQGAANLPVADDLTPLSSAKAMAVRAPLPVYPYKAKHDHIAGDGVCVMTVDTASGKVTDATMKQSTGNAILDKATTNAFRKWRFKPGTVSTVRVPITYGWAEGWRGSVRSSYWEVR